MDKKIEIPLNSRGCGTTGAYNPNRNAGLPMIHARTIRRICIAALLLSLLHIQAAAETKPPLTGEQFREDLSEAYRIMKRLHPNLTVYTEPGALDELHEKLEESVSGQVTIGDAYLAISELVGAVCDEHTLLLLDDPDELRSLAGWSWFE